MRDMLNLHDIGTFDAIYSCHNLEHLYPYQVPRALAEFRRVLNPKGAVIIMVPDLEDIKPDTKIIMDCEMGPICGLDVLYGHHSVLESRPYMAHHCGFIQSTLDSTLKEAGFVDVKVERLGNYNLFGSGAQPA